MTTERIHPGHCPTCDARTALEEFVATRTVTRGPSPLRLYVESLLAERYAA